MVHTRRCEKKNLQLHNKIFKNLFSTMKLHVKWLKANKIHIDRTRTYHRLRNQFDILRFLGAPEHGQAC